MTSTETTFRDFFLTPKAWNTLLWGGLSMFLFLPFGYFRLLSTAIRQHNQSGPLQISWDKSFWRTMASAWPLGAFYMLIPLGFAWSFASIFELMLVDFLSPIVWGLAIIFSLTVTATALTVVEDDPERYFLSLDFENVLENWWKMRGALIFPVLTCYGVVALLGRYFYGFGFFIALSVLIRVAAHTHPKKALVQYP